MEHFVLVNMARICTAFCGVTCEDNGAFRARFRFWVRQVGISPENQTPCRTLA